jgi:hypothetical protein
MQESPGPHWSEYDKKTRIGKHIRDYIMVHFRNRGLKKVRLLIPDDVYRDEPAYVIHLEYEYKCHFVIITVAQMIEMLRDVFKDDIISAGPYKNSNYLYKFNLRDTTAGLEMDDDRTIYLERDLTLREHKLSNLTIMNAK